MSKKVKSYSKEEYQELMDIVKTLEAENRKLQIANVKLKIALEKLEVDESEINISDAEAICVEQIGKLKEQSASRMFTQEDSKILDILHRNLKMARGELAANPTGKKMKKMSNKDLLSIVKDN